MSITDPDTDGDRCIYCERLLFPSQRQDGACGECPDSQTGYCPPCAAGDHSACMDTPCECWCDPMSRAVRRG